MPSVSAHADEVILRDGAVIRGTVLPGEDTAPVQIEVLRGEDRLVVEVPREEVRRIRRLGKDEEEQVRAAEAALLEGRHDQAVLLLRRLVAERPKDARAQRELGFALLLASRPKEALAPLQGACALDSLDLEAHLLLAQAFDGLDRTDEAVDTFRKATRLKPGRLSTWLDLARLLLERGAEPDRREALDAYRRASREDPTDEQVAVAWAGALLVGGQREEARRVLLAFAKRVPAAVRAGRALAKLDAFSGRFGPAAGRLGSLLGRQRPPEDALPLEVREALGAERDLFLWLGTQAASPSPTGTDAASLSGPDLPLAERRLLLMLDLLPEEGRLQLALARVLLRLRRWPEARVWLERAALSGPPRVAEDGLLLQQLALALQRAELVPGTDRPEALLGQSVSLPRATRLALLVPWLGEAHWVLGKALVREGRFADAAEAYARGAQALRAPPGDAAAPDPGAALQGALEAAAQEAKGLAEQQRRNRGT